MMIELDLVMVAVAVASSAISVLATWYFSRRHYMMSSSRRQQVTELDINLTTRRNEFRFQVIVAVLIFLFLVVLIASGTYCRKLVYDNVDDTTQAPSTHYPITHPS